MMGYLANPAMGKKHEDEIEKKTSEAIDVSHRPWAMSCGL